MKLSNEQITLIIEYRHYRQIKAVYLTGQFDAHNSTVVYAALELMSVETGLSCDELEEYFQCITGNKIGQLELEALDMLNKAEVDPVKMLVDATRELIRAIREKEYNEYMLEQAEEAIKAVES